MGRKTAFFQWAFKCIGQQERLGRHGTFKSRALWRVRDGKGLSKKSQIIESTVKFMHPLVSFQH
jgi:hypothetical protein